jgi:hypothetical protein
MGWSFRKSASFGPFRLNFSKSGIGASFGVKGARISVNSRGTYVSVGAGGIYYRERIGGARKSSSSTFQDIPIVPVEPLSSDIPHTITTDDVETATDVDSMTFVKELEAKLRKKSLWKWFGLFPSVLIMLFYVGHISEVVRTEQTFKEVFTVAKRSVNLRHSPDTHSRVVAKAKEGMMYDVSGVDSTGWVKVRHDDAAIDFAYIRADMGSFSKELLSEERYTIFEEYPIHRYLLFVMPLLLIGWCVYMVKNDQRRKTLSIFYTLETEVEGLHAKFLDYFHEFAATKKIWQKLHTKGVVDQKYNAGASQLVSRRQIYVSPHRLPASFLKTNISIPYIALRNTELFFFPERLILKRGNSFGAIFYKNINVESSPSKFIEEESLAADATVVDHTWKYLNKSGGPDRRFSDNRKLPICLYTDYEFTSANGLNEIITTSKPGAMDKFVAFIKVIGDFQRKTSLPQDPL